MPDAHVKQRWSVERLLGWAEQTNRPGAALVLVISGPTGSPTTSRAGNKKAASLILNLAVNTDKSGFEAALPESASARATTPQGHSEPAWQNNKERRPHAYRSRRLAGG